MDQLPVRMFTIEFWVEDRESFDRVYRAQDVGAFTAEDAVTQLRAIFPSYAVRMDLPQNGHRGPYWSITAVYPQGARSEELHGPQRAGTRLTLVDRCQQGDRS